MVVVSPSASLKTLQIKQFFENTGLIFLYCIIKILCNMIYIVWCILVILVGVLCPLSTNSTHNIAKISHILRSKN